MPNAEVRAKNSISGWPPSAKHILQAAAAAAHRSVSEFVLASALERAEEILPDRRRFSLSVEQWKAFQAALSAPTRRSARLSRLLKEPSVFERGGV